MEQSFIHPATGESVRLRPSEWALLEFEQEESLRREADARAGAPDTESRARPLADASGIRSSQDAPGDDEPTPVVDRVPWVARRRVRLVLTLAACAVAGVLVGVAAALTVPIDAGEPGSASAAASRTLASIGDVFEDANEYPAVDPGRSISVGYGAFRLLWKRGAGGERQDVALYAAQRGKDEYCLIAAEADRLSEAVCATAAEIALNGLHIEVPIGSRLNDDRAMHARWGSDGVLRVAEDRFGRQQVQ
ncbi:MAG: hypothetical protein ABWY36_00800 [Leifsonia sp.]